jgi:histidyl-tRNA synthetase
VIREVSESFGYQEYEGPFLEKIDLYAAKSGEELVKEQAFVFPDRGGDLITLRPELTPTLARMVAQKQNELVYPLRWWSFGPFWRYERPQKGRSREFFQWNIDVIGANSPETDAELLAVCATFFKKVGLGPQQVGIMVNDRRLMDLALSELGISPEMRPTIFRVIDRKDKLRPADWDIFAMQSGLNPTQLEGLKALLNDTELWKKSPEMQRLFSTLGEMGFGDYIHYDAKIIRGLDYYTATVFEARTLGEEGRAILGGGHYDNLVSDVGGDPLPGVGFAMGDVMIGIVLDKFNALPEKTITAAKTMVTVFDEERVISAYRTASELRSAGLKVICYPEAAKLQKQLKYADRLGIQYVVIVGPDEEAAGKVTLKDLKTSTQETMDRKDLAGHIRDLLASPKSM